MERNYGDGTARISQQRFSTGGGGGLLWTIPVSYVAAGKDPADFEDTKFSFLLSEVERELDLGPSFQASDPLVANVQETGYYRVNYDRENWDLIFGLLNANHTTIHVQNRAQVRKNNINERNE